jgi:hypothetical protein
MPAYAAYGIAAVVLCSALCSSPHSARRHCVWLRNDCISYLGTSYLLVIQPAW